MLQQIKEVKAGNQITFLLQSNGLCALKDFFAKHVKDLIRELFAETSTISKILYCFRLNHILFI